MKNQTTKNDPNNRGHNERNELEMQLRLIWLGRRDSNPRMSVPKTDALPLGDALISG
jgi:hypothetical protein